MDEFLGVPQDALEALGKIVVAGSFMERTAYDIAEALGISRADVERVKFFSRLTKRIEGELATHKYDVPPWARVSAAEIREWCGSARETMKFRDEPLHSITAGRLDELRQFEPVQQHVTAGIVKKIDATMWARIAEDILAAARRGSEIHRGLLAVVREGVYVKYWIWGPDSPGATVASSEEGWPTPPTDIEIASAVAAMQSLLSRGPGKPATK